MNKMLRSAKVMVLTLMAVMMFSSTDVLTAHAQIIFPDIMTETENGRIKVTGCRFLVEDSTGRMWAEAVSGYPFCTVVEEEIVEKFGQTFVTSVTYLDCYLTDYIKTHNASEWPSFVIKGSDDVPFYYSRYSVDGENYINVGGFDNPYYVKYCYDESTGWWVQDKAYKGPYVDGEGYGRYVETTPIEDLIEETKTAIENGEEINGTAANPLPPSGMDKAVDTDDTKNDGDNGSVNPPTEGDEITDPYADVNTLGATVKIKTDCIKVKKNNKAQKPAPTSVKVGTKALKKNKTYVISYEKYEDDWHAVDAVTDEGIYRLVITGQNGYEGVYKKRLYVTADKTIKAMSSVTVKVNKIPYAGEPITSGVIKSAKSGKRALVEGVDYTVEYMNNLNSGSSTAQVKLTAIEGSGFLGTKTVNFTITGNKMSKVKAAGISSMTYDPNAIMEQDMSNVTLTYNGTPIIKDTDFTVSYTNNTKAGTAKIVFTGKGLYYGTLTKTFKITKAPLSEDMLDDASKNIKVLYTGKALKPEVTLTNGNTMLIKGTDYTLAYSNNVQESMDTKPGKITVKAKGNYSGSININFTVLENIAIPKPISKVKVTGLSSVTYDPNKAMEQDMSNVDLTYTAAANDKQLVYNKDFTVSYTNNVKAGTAKIIFTGKGRFNGTLTKTFKIDKAPLSESMLGEASKDIKMAYTGKALKPEVTLMNGDTTLAEGTDYTLAYSNNVNVSTDAKPAYITVKGKGNYSGSFKVDFAILPESDDAAVNPNTMDMKPDAEEPVTDEEPVEDEESAEESVIEDESETDEESVEDEESAEDEESVEGEEPAEDGESVEDKEFVEDEESKEDEKPVEDEESVEDDESVEGEDSVEDEESAEDEDSAAEGEGSVEDEESITDEDSVEDEESVTDGGSLEDKESVTEEEFITDEELDVLSAYTGISIEELGEKNCEELKDMTDELLDALSAYTDISIEELKEMDCEELKSMVIDMKNNKE